VCVSTVAATRTVDTVRLPSQSAAGTRHNVTGISSSYWCLCTECFYCNLTDNEVQLGGISLASSAQISFLKIKIFTLQLVS